MENDAIIKTVYVSVMDRGGYYEWLHGNEDDICEEAAASGDPDAYLHKNAESDAGELMDSFDPDYVSYREIGAREGMIVTSTWDIAWYDLEWLPVDITDPECEMDEITDAVREHYADMAYDYMSDYYGSHGYGNEE